MSKAFRISVISFVFVVFTIKVTAADISANGTGGNWSAAASWLVTAGTDADGIPDADDNVTITGARTIVLDADFSCASLLITQGTNAIAQLTINGFTLSVIGNLSLNTTSTQTTRVARLIFNSNAAVVDVGGNLIMGVSGSGGTILVDLSNGSNFTSTLRVAGAFTYNRGTFTPGTNSTVVYDGTSAQTIETSAAAVTYANLRIDNTAGASLEANVTATKITGSYTVGSTGIFNTANFTIALATNKSVTIDGTMNAGTSTITFATGGTITINAAFNTNNLNGFSGAANTAVVSTNSPTIVLGANSTVGYTASSAQTVTARSYSNLSFSGSTKTVASGTLTVNGDWQIGSTAALNTNNPTVNVTGDITGAGAITATSGTLSISGSWLHTGTFTHNSGTVNYNNASGGQTVAGLVYRNLTLSNTSGTNTAGGNVDCFNFVMSNAAAIFDMASFDLNISGGISLSGTLKTQSVSATPIPSASWGGTVDYNNPTGLQKIILGTYTNLKSSNTSGTNTATGAVNVNGQLTVESGGTLDMATFALGGTPTSTAGTGTIQTQNSTTSAIPANVTWSPAVEYNRTGAQTIVTGTYSTLITSGSGTKTLGGNTTVTSALTLNAGTLAISTRTFTIQTTSVTNTGGGMMSMSVSGTLTFNFAGTLTFANAIFSGGLGTVNVNGGGRVNLPSTAGSPQSVINLNLNSGKLGLGANSILAIGGAVTNMSATNCLVSDGTGSIEIVGPGALGTLYFDQTTPGTTNTISNFTINRTDITGTLAIGNTVRVKTQLTPTAGTVTSNGNLVIGSDASGTGKIYPAINSSNFAFVGDVKVERYAKAKNMRRFLFLSSAVDNISVRNAWQDDIFITGPGTGGTPCGTTTGNGGTTDKYNSKGFDATTANVVSIYRYDQNNAARWVAIDTTGYALQKGRGYRVLYRGERGIADANCSTYLTLNNPPTPSEATMNVAGTLIAGSFTVDVDGPTVVTPGVTTYGYTLLGNPYACELDFGQFAAQNNTSIAPSYWTYDPNGTTSNTAYLSYSTTLGGEVAGTYHSDPSGDPNNYPNPELIGSGQAFFVQADVDGQVTFSETQKSNQVQQGLFKTQTLTSKIRIHFKQSDGTPVDNIVVRFSDNPGVTVAENKKFDAITFNSGNFLASIKGTRSFAIQTRPLNFLNDTVQLRIVSASTGNFKLEFTQFADFTEAAQIILIDQFTGIQTDIKANPVYPFTITSSAASQAGRFKLVFRSMTAVLPLSYLNVSATQKTQGVEIAWKVAYEQDVLKYQVEKSDNGVDFSSIGFVASKGNSNTAVDYTFIDANTFKGPVYYRIKSIENGPGRYSAIVKVNSTNQQPSLSLYPNPAKDRITIRNAMTSSKSTITITNAQGKTVFSAANVTVNNYSVDVSAFASGLYIVRLTNQDGASLADKFIKY